MTTEQKECLFPFTYREKEFMECTTLDSEDGKPWCYVKGEGREFGACDSTCPSKMSNQHKSHISLKPMLKTNF